MLRVTTIHASAAGSSARYYTRYLADDGPDGDGVWLGRQAAGLGLAGTVATEDLEALLSGHDPVTGTRLGTALVDRVRREGPAHPGRRRVRRDLLGAEVGVGVVGAHRRPRPPRRPRHRGAGRARAPRALRRHHPGPGQRRPPAPRHRRPRRWPRSGRPPRGRTTRSCTPTSSSPPRCRPPTAGGWRSTPAT